MEHVGQLRHEGTSALDGQDIDDDPGENGQGRQDPDAPEEVAQEEDDKGAEDGYHQIEKEGLRRPYGQVGLIELGFHNGQQAPPGGGLGYGVDGPLEQGRPDEFVLAYGRQLGGVRFPRVADRVRGKRLLQCRLPRPGDHGEDAPGQEPGGREDQNGDESDHRRLTARANESASKSSVSRGWPASWSLSANIGRIPMDLSEPR